MTNVSILICQNIFTRLLSTVEELSSKDEFKDHVKKAWHSAFSYDMIRGGVTAKVVSS